MTDDDKINDCFRLMVVVYTDDECEPPILIKCRDRNDVKKIYNSLPENNDYDIVVTYIH